MLKARAAGFAGLMLSLASPAARADYYSQLPLPGFQYNIRFLGEHVNAARALGGGGLGSLLSTLAAESDANVGTILQSLSPHSYAFLYVGALRSPVNFADNLRGCEFAQRSVEEGRLCWWSSAAYGERSVDATAGAFNETSLQFGAGLEYRLNEAWSVAFGAARAWGDNDAFARSDITRTTIGAGANFARRGWRLSAAVTADFADADIERAVTTPAFTDVLSADAESVTVAIVVAAARRFAIGDWMIELAGQASSANARFARFEESGSTAGGWRAVVEGDEPEMRFRQTLLIARELSAGAVTIRPWLTLGAVAGTDDDYWLRNRLAGSPAAAPYFFTRLEVDDYAAILAGGVSLAGKNSWALNMGYTSEVGHNADELAADLNFSFRF